MAEENCPSLLPHGFYLIHNQVENNMFTKHTLTLPRIDRLPENTNFQSALSLSMKRNLGSSKK